MKERIAFSVVLFVFAASVTGSNTYYVSNGGSDANAGTNAFPFQTITHAYSLVSAGDSIIVKPGVYTDYTPWAGLLFNKNGTASQPITIRSQYKWQAIIDAGNVSDHTECMSISGNYHIIEGFDMQGAFECGLWIKGTAKGNQVLNNTINHCGNIGDPTSSSGQAGLLSDENTSDTQYYGNYIHHNGRLSINSNLDHGMYLTGDNETIVNNIIAFNCAYGIHIAGYSTVSNMKVYNNVIAWNGRSGIMLWMAMDNIDIRNNIFYNNAELGLLCYDAHGTGVVIDYNLWYGNPQGTINMTWAGSDVSYTSGNNLIATYPYFVNDTCDYHLQPVSPAIDAGIPLSPVVADDLDGNVRPQGSGYDMGAYEYTVNTTGTGEEITGSSISVFPNPTNGKFNVQMSQFENLKMKNIEIYSTYGEKVYQSHQLIANGSQPMTIDLSSQPNGIYFLHVTTEQGNAVKKIMINK